ARGDRRGGGARRHARARRSCRRRARASASPRSRRSSPGCIVTPRGRCYRERRPTMPAEETMEEMVRQTDQLINFTREVNRRIADSGISGVEGMVALYDQLRGALAKIGRAHV